MEFGLSGKTAIVTGGASNIGRSITLSLAAEGVNVVLADIDVPQAEKVAALANAGKGGRVVVAPCDVTDRAAVQGAVALAQKNFGAAEIVVNNVGWAEHKMFMEKDWSGAEKEMALNYWGALYMTKAALPAMIERKAGRVICVSSDAGKVGEYRETVYSAAKAGVQGFVRALAKEVGRYAITVNGVCPSMTVPDSADDVGQASMQYQRVRSPEMMEKIVKLYPLRRVGRPIDVANLVVFLASDAGAFITGQNISVNGGFITN